MTPFYDPPEMQDQSEDRSGATWGDFLTGILALIACLGVLLAIGAIL